MNIQDFYDGTPQIADNMNGIMLNTLTTTPGRATHDALSYRADHTGKFISSKCTKRFTFRKEQIE